MRTVTLAALAAAAVPLAACRAPAADPGRSSPLRVQATPAEPVALRRTGRGDDAALTTPGTHLYPSVNTLPAGADTLAGLRVGFASEDLVVVTLGEQPTGGFGVTIDQAYLERDPGTGAATLVVIGTSVTPSPGDAVTQAVIHPYAYAVIGNADAAHVRAEID